jgi:hypothetical protein
MDTSHRTALVDQLRKLPGTGAERDIALQRLTDGYAAGEALSALHNAVARERAKAGVVSDVLSAASAAWDGCTDRGEAGAPDAGAREQLRAAVSSPAFLALVPIWIRELREIAVTRPETGACTVASALQLWMWTMSHFQGTASQRATAIAELADASCALIAARCRILELANDSDRAERPDPRHDDLLADLCHVQAARAAGAVGTVCAELVFGYRRHLEWNAEGCASCYGGDELDELEGLMPGIASAARAHSDVVESDGSHAAKAGPCARFDGVETFTHLRARLDGCLTGARLAKDRAASALFGLLADPSALQA